ncbi:MAG TPA: hypothetical protein VG273_28000 [Bryobacteraceae bacterium]|nr:hypothetical protein [Bryobacteraceae bacterium]
MPEVARAVGEHWAQSTVEAVGDLGGLVDQEPEDGGESADGAFAAGKADDAGAVGERDGDGIIAVAARPAGRGRQIVASVNRVTTDKP